MKIVAGVIIVLIVALVGILGAVIVDNVTGTWEPSEVLVVDSFYEPSKIGTGVGPNTNGGTTVLITSTPAQYDLLIEFPDGSRELVSTTKRTLVSARVGERMVLSCKRGGLFKTILKCE